MARPPTRTPKLGSLQEFNPDIEAFSAYIERTKAYFAVNDVPTKKKVLVLISVIGAQNYSLLRSLTAPDLPQDSSFDELVALLTKHFEPQPLVIAQRFHFYRRNQAATESIAAYVAELRRLSTHCDFAEFLDSALRDRLVCGIRSESAQKRLLSEADLTLKKAMELAQGMEAADKNAKSLKESDPAIRQITKFKPNTQSMYRKPCGRCGKTNHDAQNCHFAKATCHACGKIGHIAPAFRSSKGKKQRSSVEPPKSRGRNGNVNHLPGTDSEDDDVTIFTVGSKASQPISIEVTADQSKLSMEVDTGAAVSIISQETWKYVFPKHQFATV